MSYQPLFASVLIHRRHLIGPFSVRPVQALIEETKDLATNLLAASLVVAHNTLGGGEHDVPELTGWQKVGNPLLGVPSLEVEARGDHTTLVEAAVELNHNLLGSVVVHDLELTDVAVLLHDLQGLNSIVEHRHTHHGF